jgi:hypothetical protein
MIETNIKEITNQLGIGGPLNGPDGPDASYIVDGKVISGSELQDLYQRITTQDLDLTNSEACQQFADAVFEILHESGYITTTADPTFYAHTSESLTPQFRAAYNIPDGVNFMVCTIPTTRFGNLAKKPAEFNPTHQYFQLVDQYGQAISGPENVQTALYHEAMGSKTYFGIYAEGGINLTLLYKYYRENLINPEQGVLTLEEFIAIATKGLPGNQSRVAYSEDNTDQIAVLDTNFLKLSAASYPSHITPPGTMLYFGIRADGTWDYQVEGKEANKQPYIGQDGPSRISANRIIEAVANSIVPAPEGAEQASNLHIIQTSHGNSVALGAITALVVSAAIWYGSGILIQKIKDKLAPKKEEPKVEEKK